MTRGKQYADNSFNAGLNLDDNPIAIDNQSLTNCLNGTIITYNGNEYILQNDLGNGRVETASLPKGYVPVGVKEYGGVIYVASVRPEDGMCQIGSFPSPERNISSSEINSNNDPVISPETYFNTGSFTIKKKLFENVKINPGDKFKIHLKDPNITDEATNQYAVIKNSEGENTDTIIKDSYTYKIIPAVQTENGGLVKLDPKYITGDIKMPYSEKQGGELYVLLELQYPEKFDVTNAFNADNNLVFTFEGDYNYIKAELTSEIEDNKQTTDITENAISQYIKLNNKTFVLNVDATDGIVKYVFTPCLCPIDPTTDKNIKGIEIADLTLEGIADADPTKQYDMNLNNFDATWKGDKGCWQINYSLSGMADVTGVDLAIYYYNMHSEPNDLQATKWVQDGTTINAPRKYSYNGSFNINIFPEQKNALYYLRMDIKKMVNGVNTTVKSFYKYLLSSGLQLQKETDNTVLPQNATIVSANTPQEGGTVYTSNNWYYYVIGDKVTHIGAKQQNTTDVIWQQAKDYYLLNLHIDVDGDFNCENKTPKTTTGSGYENTDYDSLNKITMMYGQTWEHKSILTPDFNYYITEQDSVSKIIKSSDAVLQSLSLNLPTQNELNSAIKTTQNIEYAGNFDASSLEEIVKKVPTLKVEDNVITITMKTPYVMQGDSRAVTFQGDVNRYAPYLESNDDFKNIFGYTVSNFPEVAEYALSGAWGRTKDNNFRTRFGLRKFGGDDMGTEIQSHTAYNDAEYSATFSDQPNDQTWYWKLDSGSRTSVNDKFQSFVQKQFGKIPPVCFWAGTNAWDDRWDSDDEGTPNDCAGTLTDNSPYSATYNFVFILWKHTNGMYYISNQKFPKTSTTDPTAMQVLQHYFQNIYVYKSDTVKQSYTRYVLNNYKYVTNNSPKIDLDIQLNWSWKQADGLKTNILIEAPELNLREGENGLEDVLCSFILPSTRSRSVTIETAKQSITREVQKYVSHQPDSNNFQIGITVGDTVRTEYYDGVSRKPLDPDKIYYLDKNKFPRLITDKTGWKDSQLHRGLQDNLRKGEVTASALEQFSSRIKLVNGEILIQNQYPLVTKTTSRTSSGAFSIGDYFGGDSDNKHGLGREAAFVFTSAENYKYTMALPLVRNSSLIKSYGSSSVSDGGSFVAFKAVPSKDN